MSSVLLTREAKIAKLRELFGDRRTHIGELFHPTVELYNHLTTSAELTDAAKILCRWLGIKPYKLHATFAAVPAVRVKDDTIQVPDAFKEFPYQAAACLALGVIQHTLERRLHYTEIDDTFIEFATIECGLGIVVLNGLHSRRKLLTHIHHLYRARWQVRQDVTLTDCKPEEYADSLIHFARTYRIPAETWYTYVSPEARKHLLLKIARSPHVTPQYELEHRRTARRWWLHVWLLATLIALVSTLILFIMAQRVQHAPSQLVEQYNTIQILDNAYLTCVRAVKQQQNGGKVDDIYADMSINATKARCSSIRNQYNYNVTLYNQQINQ